MADGENRPWRVAREDGESFALTDDLVPGRVTFEVDGGTVTAAAIEQPNTDPPIVSGDSDRAELIAAALERLLTVDNGFGGRDVFDDIRVASQNLEPLDLDFVIAALSRLGSVQVIDDAAVEIEALFDRPPVGVAVVSVERVELLDDRAEVELHLWCGSLCGVFLTYEAVPVDGGWEITGTTGPIAMS